MSKTPFTYFDGPLKGCVPANGLSVDSSLIGVEPLAGDKRFLCGWDRTRTGGTAVRAVYKFVRGEDGKVLAYHVPELDAPEPAKAKEPAHG